MTVVEDTGRALDLLRARVVELEAELAAVRARQDAMERACGRLLAFLRTDHLPWRPHELDEAEQALTEAAETVGPRGSAGGEDTPGGTPEGLIP